MLELRSLGREDPLEKEMATRSNILAWEIPQRAWQATTKWLISLKVLQGQSYC